MESGMDIAESAEEIIRLALAEDLGVDGDITTEAVCPADAVGTGRIIAREACTVAGNPVAEKVFDLAGAGVDYRARVADGERAAPGQVVAVVEGPLSVIMVGERTALNFLCRLSGIATVTSRVVEMASGKGVEILDTRKTTPGLRVLEKYAVRTGGGSNHRAGLYDGILVKDNHIKAAGGLKIAVRRAGNAVGERFPVEVETTDLSEVMEALDAGAEIIMLDNMDPEKIKEAVGLIGGRARTEVSGGVTPGNLGEYLELGVDCISLGSLTHSAPAADMSLELDIE